MGQGGPRLAAIFPTPVILDELEDAENLNRDLRPLGLDHRFDEFIRLLRAMLVDSKSDGVSI